MREEQEKLLNEVNEAIARLSLASDERDSLFEELESVSFDNFRNVIYPIGSEMTLALSKLYDEAGQPNWGENLQFMNVKYDTSKGEEKIAVYANKNYVSVRVGAYPSVEFRNTSNSYKGCFGFGFVEKDVCEKVVDKLHEVFGLALRKYLDILGEKNKEIEERLDALRGLKAKAFHIDNKEDGSVEIHIGGKVYSGKLKEEE